MRSAARASRCSSPASSSCASAGSKSAIRVRARWPTGCTPSSRSRRPRSTSGIARKADASGPAAPGRRSRRWRRSSVALAVVHALNPRPKSGIPHEGDRFFSPSLVRTQEGRLLPLRSLTMNEYCKTCHADAYEGWLHSAHRFSSFNNPFYLASVKETRKVVQQRDGDVRGSRWCAGCHDPVPLLSGTFDTASLEEPIEPTGQAGITCTVCHGITAVNSTKGNGDYLIEEPLQYPFAFSANPFLQYVNRQLVKAKPAFHRRTFLKPVHRTSEFCSTCHKVHIPSEVTKYKDFLRGQNHYDGFLLSAASGHGARSFYYPPVAQRGCAGCHMPLAPSTDFGARMFEGADQLSIHNHLFAAANTALPFLRHDAPTVRAGQAFLADVARVDIFGVKTGGSDRRGVARAAPPEGAGASTGRVLSARDGRPHAQGRPPVQPGHRRLQRDLARGDRHQRRPHHRQERRARRRQRRSERALHQRLHAGSPGTPGRSAQRPGHLRAALRSPDSAERRGGGALRLHGAGGTHRANRGRGEAAVPQVHALLHHVLAGARRAGVADHDDRLRPHHVSRRGAPRRPRSRRLRRSTPGNAGTTTASDCCSKARPGARKASCDRPPMRSPKSSGWDVPMAP